ncbi:MAG TPA: LapA family protein [bacterium]|nr:LapA family protein [bacterium]
MNRLGFIAPLFLLVAVAVFATLNSGPVDVDVFKVTTIRTTVGMLVIGTFAAGAVVMTLFGLASRFKFWKEKKALNKELKSAKEELGLLRSRNAELAAQPKKDGE